MIVLDVLYVAVATVLVMVVLQISTFFVTRMIYPPEPKIIYRDRDVHVPAPQAVPPPVNQFPPQTHVIPQASPPPVFTQPSQDIQLPEYEPRKPATESLRVDPELPAGLQETRPDGV